MMPLLFLLFVPIGGGEEYDRFSKEQGIEEGDALMRQGRFLPAAVLYRNHLMKAGSSPSVRIPLAFALLGTGDVDYAGKQIRSAQLLAPEFSHFRFDPALLFPSPQTWNELLRTAEEKIVTADGWYFLAYAFSLSGNPISAQKALQEYIRWRGREESALALERFLQGKVPPKKGLILPGLPRSTPGTYLSSQIDPKKESHVDRKK